ncbi:hypothetical protein [Metalysinibacillus jejuensis]|nr:hypothetical protein [Metalysinibacillus jejuensis]
MKFRSAFLTTVVALGILGIGFDTTSEMNMLQSHTIHIKKIE